jgi:hypothetical protein
MTFCLALSRFTISLLHSPLCLHSAHTVCTHVRTHTLQMAPFSFGTHALEILNDDVWCDQDFDDSDEYADDEADDDYDDFESLLPHYVSFTLPLGMVAPSRWMANVLKRRPRHFNVLERFFMEKGIRPRRS